MTTSAKYLRKDQVLITLLENACSNPLYPADFDWLAAREELRVYNENRPADQPYKSDPDAPGGWEIYHISLHCASYDIVARKHRGHWQVQTITPDRLPRHRRS